LSPWLIIYRSAWGLLLVLILIGLVFLFLPKCHSIREMQRTRSELEEEGHEIAADTKTLHERRKRFQSDPVFVERVAREAGMVRQNEVLFKFSPPETNAVTNGGAP